MNMLKSLCALLFLVSVALCNEAFVQTQQQEQNQVNANGQGQDQEEYNESEYIEETDPYQQTVTIDEGEEGSTSTQEEAPMDIESKPATKIHIYSGKHDGDNVINPDPRH